MKRQLKLVTLILCAALFAVSGLAHAKCFGLYTGDSPSAEQLAKIKSLYGEAPCGILLFYDATWGPNAQQLKIIGDSGAAPILTIEPWNAQTKNAADLDENYANSLADSINEYARPVFIRFAHEMNGNWYPWSGSPEKYIAAYRRFHKLVMDRLAEPSKVKWIFSVNNMSFPDTPENKAEKYFPGLEFADVIGIDGYLNRPQWWQRAYFRITGIAKHMFGEQILEMKKFGLPVVITETAIAADDDFKSWAIKTMFSELDKDFPFVEEVVWFDVKKEADWRIASGIKSLEFFRKAIRAWK